MSDTTNVRDVLLKGQEEHIRKNVRLLSADLRSLADSVDAIVDTPDVVDLVNQVVRRMSSDVHLVGLVNASAALVEYVGLLREDSK